MDINVQNKFITAFQERMSFFIPRFEDVYERKNLLKTGQRSKIYLYLNKMNDTQYVVKEICLQSDQELEWIQRTIDSFYIIDSQICNKKNIVKSEGFYYKFNKSKMNSNAHQAGLCQTTIDFYLVLEKCDGSLDELLKNSFQKNSSTLEKIERARNDSGNVVGLQQKQQNSQMISLNIPFSQPIHRNSNLNSLKNQILLNQATQASARQELCSADDGASISALKKAPIRLQEFDFFNLYSNLKDLILQIHELDGSAIFIDSFSASDIFYIVTKNNEIDFKFSKMTTHIIDSKKQMRLLAEIFLQIGLVKQFENIPIQSSLNFANLSNNCQQNQQQLQQQIQQTQQNSLNQQQQSGGQIITSSANSIQVNKINYTNTNQLNLQQTQLTNASHNQIKSPNNNNNNTTKYNNPQQNQIPSQQVSFVNQNQQLLSSSFSFNQQYQTNSQNTTNVCNLPNNSQNISQNSSPSSQVVKQQQPVFSNSVSFKDVEYKSQNQNSNLNQSQQMQQSGSFAVIASGTPSQNNLNSNNINNANMLSTSQNQDNLIEENNQLNYQRHTEFLLENLKTLQKKFEKADIITTVTKFCKLIQSMITGQTTNQCYYQILKIYNAREFFFEFNQSKLQLINPSTQSLSQRHFSNAQFLFCPPPYILRSSEQTRARSLNNNSNASSNGNNIYSIYNFEDGSFSSSPSTIKKRSTIQRAQLSDNVDALTTYINSLKDNTLVTLVQTFSNLVNAIKQKKKKLRFEKYLTLKEMRFLKTIEPMYCGVNCISVDFGNFYQAEAMQLTGSSFESLTNLQGLELNFDFWNEAEEDQFIFMIQKLSSLTNLRLFSASLSYIGQKNNHHSVDFSKNSFQAISSMISQLPELLCLELDFTGWNTIQEQQIQNLISAIIKCKKLIQLSLIFNDIVNSQNANISSGALMEFNELSQLPDLQQLQLSFRGWGLNKKISEQNLLDFICGMAQFPGLHTGVQISFENLFQNMMELVLVDKGSNSANPLKSSQKLNSQNILQEIQKQLPDLTEIIKQTKLINIFYDQLQIMILL
ncbi:hypothetical protein TTHERM_00725870 (macronuclear) [Tetrahymena thermophila SB210]|uniref:Kinase domain protein n=1 Tax=Tetrahymena thermophila (strain SB210) TaxID=312017 RepID=Q24GK3_TETTS|nr:hypothetical protein TTHERM_00725870 [Tetrahymena thermophila SB210]EAS06868.2 hypothetical protein TTHERM_00725870 [Tetrahymena thermophila SB210]|eukprot:XP_001027110.2 hypothetical protein TTHERM_00725870 [Tetrahymena thermophila SB210]